MFPWVRMSAAVDRLATVLATCFCESEDGICRQRLIDVRHARCSACLGPFLERVLTEKESLGHCEFMRFFMPVVPLLSLQVLFLPSSFSFAAKTGQPHFSLCSPSPPSTPNFELS